MDPKPLFLRRSNGVEPHLAVEITSDRQRERAAHRWPCWREYRVVRAGNVLTDDQCRAAKRQYITTFVLPFATKSALKYVLVSGNPTMGPDCAGWRRQK